MTATTFAPAPESLRAAELRAPAPGSFPVAPVSWYFFCTERELERRPVARRMLGRDLVGFRTATGRVAVMDARCAHLGANLGRGRVVGETLQCPFHHWRFGCDGRCEDIPAQAEIPGFARQESFPAELRHGAMFFFWGPEKLFPLPFFAGESPENFCATPPFSFVAHGSWFLMVAQGFDTQHFETVHERKLQGPPVVDCPAPQARRTRYVAEVVGPSVRDRVLRLLAGATVAVTITNWGGSLFLVEAKFPRAHSRFLVIYEPAEGHQTRCHVMTFARRGWPALGLPLRRWLTRGHLLAEAELIRDIRYQPTRLISADVEMVRCLHWLATLPQGSDRPLSEAAEKPDSTFQPAGAPHLRCS